MRILLTGFGCILIWLGIAVPSIVAQQPDSLSMTAESLETGEAVTPVLSSIQTADHPLLTSTGALLPGEPAVHLTSFDETGNQVVSDDEETGSMANTASRTDAVPTGGDDEPHVNIGGALRFNFLYTDWEGSEDNRNKWGEFHFDTFRLNVTGRYRDIYIMGEYRFYAGYHFLKSGYFGYDFSEILLFQTGLIQVPFGLLDYASSNWFFQMPYYIGLEDSHASGFKTIYNQGPIDAQLGFFFNPGGSFTGSSIGSARYSYDVVHTNASELGYADSETAPLGFEHDPQERRQNSTSNQLNARGTYTLDVGPVRTELGASAQASQLYNAGTRENGHHWAAAVHADLSLNGWNLKLQALRYEYHPQNPEGQDDRFVVMGAYDAPYKVASKADNYLAGLSYSLPVNIDPISSITFYNDYSLLAKHEDTYYDSQQNVTGMMLSAGQLFTYVDMARGRNHAWFGTRYGSAFAEGDPDAGWNTRFNINVGYYF